MYLDSETEKPVAECVTCGEYIWPGDEVYEYDGELYCGESCIKEKIVYDLNYYNLDPFRSQYQYERFIRDLVVRV